MKSKKSDEHLISSYILDGKGGAKTIGWKEIKDWKKEDGILWIHLNYQSETSVQWLKNESGLDPIIIEDMITSDVRPRCFFTKEGISVFLRGVNLNPGSDPEDMISIRTWFDKNRIITTRNRRVLSINDLREALDKGIGPKTATEFIIMLNSRLVHRMGDVITDIEQEVDAIEESVLSGDRHNIRLQLAELRRQVILIRRYLAPQREALFALKTEDTQYFFTDNEILHLTELSDKVVHYIEDLDASRDRSILIQEELNSKMTEDLNSRMYLLSMVTVFFLPLSFVTGLLGINVGGIPGTVHPFAFYFVCSMLLILGVFILIMFKIKKWF